MKREIHALIFKLIFLSEDSISKGLENSGQHLSLKDSGGNPSVWNESSQIFIFSSLGIHKGCLGQSSHKCKFRASLVHYLRVCVLTELISRNYLKDGPQLGRHSLIKDGKHKIGQGISCLKTLLTW